MPFSWLGGGLVHKVFVWFYCLPVGGVLMLILLTTVAFFFLRENLNHSQYWKMSIIILLACWIAVVLFATVWQRTKDTNALEPVLQPFASYLAVINGGTKELLRANFMNAVLFYPAGLLGVEALPKRWRKLWSIVLITAIFALVSFGIEYTQYRFGMGVPEADDLIHNTLGVLVGGIVSKTFKS